MPVPPSESMSRRTFVSGAAFFPLFFRLGWVEASGQDAAARLKLGYQNRLKALLSAGHLPYIDIESSCNPTKINIPWIVAQMDELGIGLMALSADPTRSQFEHGTRYDSLAGELITTYPDYFIPTGNGGQPPYLTEATNDFFNATIEEAKRVPLFLLGEYEIRHYPSPRQFKRGETDRDVTIPIDGPIGHRIFALSQELGIPFQLHYEIENDLLVPLEKMLAGYPRAKMIWCHLAQVRYSERASDYSADYVEGLIKRFPNLYFDTAFGDAQSVYPGSNQRHARVWKMFGGLREEWLELMVSYPGRFLSALDLGGDRINQLPEYDRKHRDFLSYLPRDVQHQIAYRSAWKLLFQDDFS